VTWEPPAASLTPLTADFQCFADLALASPSRFNRREGQGIPAAGVLTPGDPWISRKNAEIVADVEPRCGSCFPSAKTLTLTWSNVMNWPSRS